MEVAISRLPDLHRSLCLGKECNFRRFSQILSAFKAKKPPTSGHSKVFFWRIPSQVAPDKSHVQKKKGELFGFVEEVQNCSNQALHKGFLIFTMEKPECVSFKLQVFTDATSFSVEFYPPSMWFTFEAAKLWESRLQKEQLFRGVGVFLATSKLNGEVKEIWWSPKKEVNRPWVYSNTHLCRETSASFTSPSFQPNTQAPYSNPTKKLTSFNQSHQNSKNKTPK